MASLGNIGKFFRWPKSYQAWQFFTLDKQPSSVDMAGTGPNASTVPYAFVVLTRNATRQYQTRADGSGNWHFYDMDDSLSQVYSVATYTQAGATGEAWTATVSGTTVVVTKVFSAQRAVATAFA